MTTKTRNFIQARIERYNGQLICIQSPFKLNVYGADGGVYIEKVRVKDNTTISNLAFIESERAANAFFKGWDAMFECLPDLVQTNTKLQQFQLAMPVVMHYLTDGTVNFQGLTYSSRNRNTFANLIQSLIP